MDPTQILAEIIALCLDRWTIILTGGVYFLIRFLRRLPFLADRRAFHHALPLLPEVFAVSLAVAGAVPSVASEPLPLRVAVGLWMAYLASKFQKVLGQTVLGDDERIAELVRARMLRGGTVNGVKASTTSSAASLPPPSLPPPPATIDDKETP